MNSKSRSYCWCLILTLVGAPLATSSSIARAEILDSIWTFRPDRPAPLVAESIKAKSSSTSPQLAAAPPVTLRPVNFATYSLDEYLSVLQPEGRLNRQTGEITLDLADLNQKLVPELIRRGLKPSGLVVLVDGGADHGGETLNLPLGQNEVSYRALPLNRQQNARVMIVQGSPDNKKPMRPLHISNAFLIETLNYPRIKTDHPDPELYLPKDLTQAAGFEANLVKLSSEIQHRNTIWTVSGASKNAELRKQFYKYGADLIPTPLKDDKGRLRAWRLTNKQTKEFFEAAPDEVMLIADAAFSEHHFYWDAHMIAEALAATDPDIAWSTIRAWLSAQIEDGGIPRETDLKWTAYEPEFHVKLGKVGPNPEWFNPPLGGWAAHQLVRWSPKDGRDLLPALISSSERQRRWLVKHFGVLDDKQNLIGFRWSTLGSGRDNAPRPLDVGGLAVDLMAQYKIMLDCEREFHLMLGQFDEAQKGLAEASSVARTLNERYYSDRLKWYHDLEPDGRGGFNIHLVQNFSGFWPAAARVPHTTRLGQMIEENLMNPRRFGGGLFLPSLAKDSPYYDEAGRYWRGGGWPPDWSFSLRALYESGQRALAASLIQQHLAAMTTASRSFAAGLTPENLIKYLEPIYKEPHGMRDSVFVYKVRARMKQFFADFEAGRLRDLQKPGRDTVFESYGLFRDSKGRPVATFNQELSESGHLHNTRSEFGGWGAVPGLIAPRFIVGLDAVPAFWGESKQLKRWLFALLTEPQLSYHQVRNNPAFKPLLKWMSARPQHSLAQFAQRLERSKEMMAELELVGQGYLELSPTFDPKVQETKLKNFIYNGVRFDLSLDYQESNNTVKISVNSPSRLRLQFNQQWRKLNGVVTPLDQAAFSTKILELGGERKSIEIKLPPTSNT